MRSITLSPETCEKLRQVKGQVDIVDEAGRYLGYFLPIVEESPDNSAEILDRDEHPDRPEAEGEE